MTTPDMKKAREWAEDVRRIEAEYGSARPDALAGARIIESLPDTVVDGDKLRELVEKADEGFYSAGSFLRRVKELLPAPPLPTLADLIEQGKDPADYIFRWMKTEDGIELLIMENDECVYTLDSRGYRFGRDFHEVTPLPDLPKLEWPGSTPDDVAYATGGALTTQDVVDECRAVRKERANTAPTLPRPEDVPAGEPWLVEFNGHKWVGTREATDQIGYPWALSRLDGVAIAPAKEVEVTLVSRLVPEDQS